MNIMRRYQDIERPNRRKLDIGFEVRDLDKTSLRAHYWRKNLRRNSPLI